ncbi:MAG TPA: hypothetical protein VGG91_07070 [Myxococcaceae bacterium]
MRSTKAFLLLPFVALLAASLGCGSGTSQTQASIGPAGGSLSLPSPAVQFDVPAGALTETTLVTLRANADAQSVLVALEPSQLALAKPGQLLVTLDGPKHISSVTEVRGGGEQPIGVDVRMESLAGASAQLRLDRLTQVRMRMGDGDGGTGGACREDDGDHRGRDHGGDMDDGDHDGEHHDGGMDGDDDHHDGGVADGGHEGEHDDGGVLADGGVPGPDGCPDGFECDDGVCVAHGGNHEDDCRGHDSGTCRDDDDDQEHGDAGHP